MYGSLWQQELESKLSLLQKNGLYKKETVFSSPQSTHVLLADGRSVINFCSNNYLGLSNHPDLIAAARKGMDDYGFGLSSVRFICGTQDQHIELEKQLAQFLGTEAALLYSSCYDANGGVFETLLDEECAVLTDSLNHASIVDGIRLCKASRWIYAHGALRDTAPSDKGKNLEACLRESGKCKRRLIVSDGVFSMDGDIADLGTICDLAEQYDALVMVDDSHATGIIGPNGRGSIEECRVGGRVDIITTTFGKALGGASGGAVAGRKEIIEYLRQGSRPYLFSNSLSPPIVSATLCSLQIIKNSPELRARLFANTIQFRKGMTSLGYEIKPGHHPICPVMLYDEKCAGTMSQALLEQGIFAVGFFYPVVPKGQARIRLQISALHTSNDIQSALLAFEKLGKKLSILP